MTRTCVSISTTHARRIPTSSTAGASFAWSRPNILGIFELGATGNGDINETLHNDSLKNINVVLVKIAKNIIEYRLIDQRILRIRERYGISI